VPALDRPAAGRAASTIAGRISAITVERTLQENQLQQQAITSLCSVLIDLVDKVDRSQLGTIATALTAAKSKALWMAAPQNLDEAIRKAIEGVGPESAAAQTGHVIDDLLATLDKAESGMAIEQAGRGFRPNLRGPNAPAPTTVLEHMATPEILRLLAHPLACGGLRRVFLDQLGERYQHDFRGTWEFLDWARANGVDVTPSRAPAPDAGKDTRSAG
jgi:hypothetical protein